MITRDRPAERFLATILFTDMVGSTDLAARLGDREWRRVVAAHHAVVRRQLKRFAGREIDTAGDGFLASFDSPAEAVRAADAILGETAALGLSLRAGVHTGECEMIGRKVGGIAVHIAARVVAAAEADQVLVSSTVRELVAGSGLQFTDSGTHALKGIPGEWHLFALVRQAAPPPTAEQEGIVLPTADSAAEARRRRRWIAVAAVALVVLAGTMAALALLGVFTGLGPARPLTPGPDSIVAIGRESGAIVEVRGVAGGPVAIEIIGDRLWVAGLDSGVVTDLAIADVASTRTTGHVGRPSDLAAGGGVVWVADAFDKTVTLIDVNTGAANRTVENVLARHIAYGADAGWATDDLADKVLRLDRQSGDVALAIDVGPGAYPSGLAFGANAIWVGNAGTSTLARIDPLTATVTATGIALRAVPDAIAAGARDVWVAARAADELLRVDPGTNAVSATIAVCDQPAALAVDGETVWVGCAGTHEVWHLARDGTTLAKTNVGGVPTDIAVYSDRVFVTVRRP